MVAAPESPKAASALQQRAQDLVSSAAQKSGFAISLAFYTPLLSFSVGGCLLYTSPSPRDS